jgi:hypothetical protein
MSAITSVLIRNGRHASTGAGAATERYMLLCDNLSVSIAKTPIQVPLPQKTPVLIDLGMFRPSISISGLIDTIGGDTSNVTSATVTRGMVGTSISLKDSDTGATSSQTYYTPYKNALETAAYLWLTDADTPLEVEVLDAATPLSMNYSTGTITQGSGSTTVTGSGTTFTTAMIGATFTRASGAANIITAVASATGMTVTSADAGGLVSAGTAYTIRANSTGGGIYPVTFQQARFQVDAAKEDRWTYSLQFAAGSRIT